MMKPSRKQKSAIKKLPKAPLSDDELAGFIMLQSQAPEAFAKLMLNSKIKSAFDKSIKLKQASAEG